MVNIIGNLKRQGALAAGQGSQGDALARAAVWLWPAAGVVLSLLIWGLTTAGADRDAARAARDAVRDAGAYAEAYEQYVTRSVAQMDQVSMQLKQSWEQAGARLDLEALRRDGMFTDSEFVSVAILDADGRRRTATYNGAGGAGGAGGAPRGATASDDAADAFDVSRSAYFNFHKNNNSTALRLAVPPGQHGSAQSTVQFSRRLDGRDDSFAGVVLLTVNASYFTSFYSSRALGQDGVVALLGDDGQLRLERHGAGVAGLHAGLDAGLDNTSLLLASPWSGSGMREGLSAQPGAAAFRDGRERILAWHRSSAYPVTALVGLSRAEVMAASDAARAAGQRRAAVFGLLLLALSSWAGVLARRAQARRHEEAEVRRAYRTATESGNDGFYMASALRDHGGAIVDFEIVDCNERGAFFYGLSRAEMLGTRLSRTDSGVFGEALFDTYVKAMTDGFYEDDRQMPADNRFNISWGHRRLVRVGNGLAITLQDISERKAHEGDLARLANEDALTALPNRHWLQHHLPGALAAARARALHSADAGVDANADAGAGTGPEQALLGLLFIDLDEFKHVNDTQGHAAGDLLLRQAAARLKSLLRPSDHVVRFGGDEFIVLLDPAESDAQVARVAERILKAFARPFDIAEESQVIGASIGISMFPRDGDDPESLIKHGDIAMYSGKTDGKGQYRFFDPALSTRLKSRARLKSQLIEAIEKDQLQLYYQPRVDTQTGLLCSVEALVRWVHPELGLIAPAEFIPLAESNGLILPIGEIVMAKACAQLARWRAQGLPLVPVSINVSPRQFAQGNIHRQLAVHLARHRIDPGLLEVEITESAMMGEQDEIIAELAAIRDLGVKLHVDDFGTGYSSLSQLQKLRMDVLKVDKAFTAGLGKSQEGRVFFQAIVSMAHALGMTVVAEGVETLQQLRLLQELGCNEVQGYYIARPMPPDDIATCMRRRHLFPDPNLGSGLTFVHDLGRVQGRWLGNAA